MIDRINRREMLLALIIVPTLKFAPRRHYRPRHSHGLWTTPATSPGKP